MRPSMRYAKYSIDIPVITLYTVFTVFFEFFVGFFELAASLPLYGSFLSAVPRYGRTAPFFVYQAIRKTIRILFRFR